MDPEIRRILEGFSDTERADWRRLFGDRFPLDYRIPDPCWRVPLKSGPKPFSERARKRDTMLEARGMVMAG